MVAGVHVTASQSERVRRNQPHQPQYLRPPSIQEAVRGLQVHAYVLETRGADTQAVDCDLCDDAGLAVVAGTKTWEFMLPFGAIS